MTESYGERKGRKLFEKVFDPSKKLFIKKHPTRFSIDRNLRFDRSKQTKAHSKIVSQFRLIEKQPQSIEIPEKTQF